MANDDYWDGGSARGGWFQLLKAAGVCVQRRPTDTQEEGGQPNLIIITKLRTIHRGVANLTSEL